MNNQELDAIGKRLFAASRLTEAEIDRIASSPDMFDGVRRRISHQSKEEPASVKSFRIPKLAFGSALATALGLGVFAFYLQQDRSASLSVAGPATSSPVQHKGPAPALKTVKAFSQAYATFPDEKVATSSAPVVDVAVQRETRRSQPRFERAGYTKPQENDFVAVTYVGEGAESTRGGRVIRVDVPRSTLFAMGFPVSLENESPTVKADLLIGPDGVTRAVRLVE